MSLCVHGQHPDPRQVCAHLDTAPDGGRVDRVIVGVQPDVVVAGQPVHARHPVCGATGATPDSGALIGWKVTDAAGPYHSGPHPACPRPRSVRGGAGDDDRPRGSAGFRCPVRAGPSAGRAGTRFEVGRLADYDCQVALTLVGKGNHAAAVLAERAISAIPWPCFLCA